MKKILYIAQWSMSDGKEMFLTKDGQFIIAKTFLKILKSYLSDFEFIIEVPNFSLTSKETRAELETKLKEIHENVDFEVNHSFGISPILNRYSFDATNSYQKYDLIINSIPEITRNIRAMLGSKKIPIISLHHFVDLLQDGELVNNWQNGQLFNYFWRQFDGYISSDYNIFNSNATLNSWNECLENTFTQDILSKIETKSFGLNYYTDLFDYVSDKIESKFETFTSIFPARITESMYTGWKTCFDMFLNEKITSNIIFCNPSFTKGVDVIKKFYPNLEFDDILVENVKMLQHKNIYIVNENMSRENYLKFSQKCQCVINFYFAEKYGGIAIREVIARGDLLPFVPNIYQFSTWFEGIDKKYLFDSDKIDLVTKFNEYVTLYNTETHKIIKENFWKNEHYVSSLDTFFDIFKEIDL